MQITKRLIAIGVASAATVATGLGVATTADGASAPAKVHHLKFVIIDGPAHRVGPRSFAGTDVNRHQGKIVGYDTFTVKFNFHAEKAFVRQAFSRKGGLLFAGTPTVSDHGPFTGKVTGGRGRFSGARGTVRGFAPKHSNKTFVRIRYHF